MRTAAAVSALFILFNSTAGLVGYLSSGRPVPSFACVIALAAITGGTLGSHFGCTRFPVRTISLLLSAVLLIAGAKLILTR